MSPQDNEPAQNKIEAAVNKAEAAVSSPANITLLKLAFQALSLLEKLLPAFLVAWNNQLRQKNRELESRLALAKVESDAEAYKKGLENEEASKKPGDVLSDFLSDK